MPKWRDIANIWKNIGEVDIRPIRDEAMRDVRIALVGQAGMGKEVLAEQLRRDPSRASVQAAGTSTEGIETPSGLILRESLRPHASLAVLGLEDTPQAAKADLIILVVGPQSTNLHQQNGLADRWLTAGKKVVVLYNTAGQSGAAPAQVIWDASRFLSGDIEDPKFLLGEFASAVIALLPERVTALARQYPLFRVPVAHYLINETSFSNAAYSFSTGLAEVVPGLGIPLNITDMIVLTKAQAFLVYRLGLAFGFSTNWQDYVAEFGSVVGSGFLWRQLARSLVGFIPVWGILPKTAIAYAGTYAVGHTVLRWYLTGRHISPHQISQLYRQAFLQGKGIARSLLARRKEGLLGRGKQKQLAAGERISAGGKIGAGETDSAGGKTCPACGKISGADALFCQYCGERLAA